jgi:hypothetical protein
MIKVEAFPIHNQLQIPFFPLWHNLMAPMFKANNQFETCLVVTPPQLQFGNAIDYPVPQLMVAPCQGATRRTVPNWNR